MYTVPSIMFIQFRLKQNWFNFVVFLYGLKVRNAISRHHQKGLLNISYVTNCLTALIYSPMVQLISPVFSFIRIIAPSVRKEIVIDSSRLKSILLFSTQLPSCQGLIESHPSYGILVTLIFSSIILFIKIDK